MRQFATLVLALCVLAVTLPSTAADYPERNVRIVVPAPPAGQTDFVARIIAEKLTQRLGRTFYIENRAGASGNIGTDLVAKSPADGYTLVMAAINAFGANPALYRSMPFDPVKDFSMIINLVSTTNVLVVGPRLHVRTLPELLRRAKAEPGKLTYASPGAGTSAFLFMELLKLREKVDITHISYKGSAPALNDLLGGHVDMAFDSQPAAAPHLQSGALRALAVSSAKRSPAIPDVPTMDEAGVKDFAYESWLALATPKGTPKAIVDKLNAELNSILQMPDVRERFMAMGTQPVGGSPGAAQAFVASQVALWQQVVEISGVPTQ